MSLVALFKTSLSYFTDYLFTVYRWMKDAGRKMQKITTDNENLNRNLHVKKRWVWNKAYIHNWTCIRENKIDRFIKFLLQYVDDFNKFLVLFLDWKKKTQKRTLKMQVKVIQRKTKLGNNLDMELKDKYETRVHK